MIMTVTIDHADGYHQSYACSRPLPGYGIPTPREAYDYVLSALASSGAHPVGDEAALTITTHTPTAQVVRTFTGGLA